MNDVELWNKFCETYDYKYLDKLSEDGLKVLKKIIFNDPKVRYIGLYLILDNHFYPSPYKKIDYVSDIMRITHMTSIKYNKNVYLIGERHKTKGECKLNKENSMIIGEFIANNLQYSDKFIDVFIEAQFIKPKRITNSQDKFYYGEIGMGYIVEKFPKCFNLYKQIECDYPNIRFHSSNIRPYGLYNITKNITFLDEFYNLIRSIGNIDFKNDHTYEFKKKNIEEIFKTLELQFPVEMSKYKKIQNQYELTIFFIEQYNNIISLLKQQESIKYEEVKKVIAKTLIDSVNKLENFDVIKYDSISKFIKELPSDEDIQKYQLISKKLENKNTDITSSDINLFLKILRINNYKLDVSYYFIMLNVLFMDTYLVSRMFRTFKKIPYKYSNEPQNIIIYVGDIHAQNYIKILLDLEFKMIFNESNEDQFCIDIRQLKQPLFS